MPPVAFDGANKSIATGQKKYRLENKQEKT